MLFEHQICREAFMFGLGGWEIVGILVVIFLLFGATRLPQLAKSLGESRKAFKEGMREAEESEAKAESQQLSAAQTPAVSQLSDEEILAEMRRRTDTANRS